MLASVPGLDRGRIQFTPNFAARAEYAWALEQNIRLTIDNLYILREWGELFRGQRVFVRIDTGTGRGHHHHVRTAGAHAKFGVPVAQVDELSAADRAPRRDCGRTACAFRQRHLRCRQLGGGGDAAARPGTAIPAAAYHRCRRRARAYPTGTSRLALDLAQLDTALLAVRQNRPGIALWIEPGRYLVAAAGVLIARVTQTKSKDDVRYVGIATGMNSLIRPALYGAWHEIVNLTRLDEPATEIVNVVGPICESADFLGHDRLLPPTREGDVLLIANAGAYGHAMSSRYNLREPAQEFVL